MSPSATAAATLSPFDLIGGRPVIERVVDRFYDLMDSEPRFAALRAMHAPDLALMRLSLAGFLCGWAGGPRDWFEANPGKCMMSAHGSLAITHETAEQWLEAMSHAFEDCGLDEDDVATLMMERFTMMSRGMVQAG